jgi:ligand-binding SRPBCC domain-containing protein
MENYHSYIISPKTMSWKYHEHPFNLQKNTSWILNIIQIKPTQHNSMPLAVKFQMQGGKQYRGKEDTTAQTAVQYCVTSCF